MDSGKSRKSFLKMALLKHALGSALSLKLGGFRTWEYCSHGLSLTLPNPKLLIPLIAAEALNIGS